MPRSKKPKPVKGKPVPAQKRGFDPAALKGTAIKGHPQVPRVRPIRIPGKS